MINNNLKNRNNYRFWLNSYFNIILIVILVLFLILAYWLVLGPKFSATQAAVRANIAGEERLYARVQEKRAALLDIQKVYKNIKSTNLQKFNNVLPAKYIPDRLFGELAEIVKTGGWSTNEIKLNLAVKPNGNNKLKIAKARALANRLGLGKIDLTLSVSAIDYSGLKRLLSILENNLRLIDVAKVDFSPSDNTVILDLSTYYYKTIR